MATTRKQVSYGSSGSDVTELQKTLNQNGYQLDVDGKFGPKTQAAVKDYQSKNGLKVDGIAGVNTWGALDGSSTAAQPQASTATKQQAAAPTTPSTPSATASGGNYAPYTESETVTQAKALLDQQLAAKPGEYQSTWEGQLSDTIAKILNREPFSYDLNGDALYQQYKDMYVQQGKMAMMDTMGQAAAMTGGYGNSYAQSVGQQAYQGYLQQLNDVVPELYGAAYDRYNQEGQDLYNQYAMLGAQEEQDYARYQDELSAYYAELDRRQNRYNAERDYDYSQYVDNRNFDYQQDRDAVADDQWQQQYDESIRQYTEQMAYQKERDAVEDQQWQQQYEESIRQYDEQFAYQSMQDAYSRSMDLISRGIMPSKDELAAAGFDSATIDTIVNMANGNGSTGEISPSDWYNINEKCAEYAASSEGMLKEYVAGIFERGWISENEANALLDLYFPDTKSQVTDTTVSLENSTYNAKAGGGQIKLNYLN